MKYLLKITVMTTLTALMACTLSVHAQTSSENASPIIADLDGNGRISRSEAENMMNSPALKSELFNAAVELSLIHI